MSDVVIHCGTCNDTCSDGKYDKCGNEYSKYFNMPLAKDFHCPEWRQTPPYVVFCEWWNETTLFISVVTGYGGRARKFERKWMSFDIIPEMSEDDIARHRNSLLSEARKFLKAFDLDLDNSWSIYPRWLTTSNDYKQGLVHVMIDPGTTACGRHLSKFNKMPPVEGMRHCEKCKTKVIHQI